MAAQILHSVSSEPPLLRWLHSHDPDRDMTQQLLDASATYITAVPPSDPAHLAAAGPPVPPAASLFVPMYRRKQFILGQLYAPLSPNAVALAMLARAGYGPPPAPISRRFVVDLSFPTLNFLEYEWFSDGKLCVTMHFIDPHGLYTAEAILLHSPPARPAHVFARHDLLLSANRPAPTKVIMRIRVREHPPCQICYAQRVRCTCPSTMRDRQARKTYASPTNWESWIAAMTYTRSGLTTTTVSFTILAPTATLDGSNTLLLHQTCELGVGDDAPNGAHLLTMFFHSAGMLVSHPATDAACRAAEEKRHRINLANELSEESEDWASPHVVLLLDSDNDDPAVPVPRVPVPRVDHPPPPPPPPPPAFPDHPAPPDPPVVLDSAFTSVLSNDIPVPQVPAPAETLVGPHLQHAEARDSNAPEQLQSIPHHPATARDAEQNVLLPHGLAKPPPVAKRKGKARHKLFACADCPRVFDHKGHFNEHRLCVHEKVRLHKCAFVNCQSRFFKKSDRDRHMRSKHGFTAVACPKCDATLSDKQELDAHMRQAHKADGKHTCEHCAATYSALSALRQHYKTCKPS